MKRALLAVPFAAALAISGTSVAFAAASQHSSPAPTSTAVTAVTVISNRPDSGTQGNTWALDNFTRTASITFVRSVLLMHCPGSDTGHCYLWQGTISDKGTFSTQAGAKAPRTGTMDRALTGIMSGGSANISFYSSWKTARSTRVPTTENDGSAAAAGRKSTTNWVEQFFGASAVFNSWANHGGPELGTTAGWTYAVPFGTDTACPNDAYRWVDAAQSSWGTMQTDGNILTPSASDCT